MQHIATVCNIIGKPLSFLHGFQMLATDSILYLCDIQHCCNVPGKGFGGGMIKYGCCRQCYSKCTFQ